MRIAIGMLLGLKRATGGGGGGPDITAPTFVSAALNTAGTSLALTFSETLDNGSIPANAQITVAGACRAPTVTGIGISGSVVTCTLSAPVLQGETVTFSYVVPVTGKIRDAAFNAAAAIASGAITNGSTVAFTPQNILGVTSGNYRADLGNVTIATGVSQWTDLSGNGRHYTQAGTTQQPLHTASDATLNNNPTITFDNTNDQMTSTYAPDLSAAPVFRWAIMKVITWTSGRSLLGGAGTTPPRVSMSGTTPNLQALAASSIGNNAGAVLGTWQRWRTQWHGTAGQASFRIGATAVTGASSGVGVRTTTTLGSGLSGANFAIAEEIYCDYVPTAAQIAALDTYGAARYPAAGF